MTKNLFSRRRQAKRKQKQKRHNNDFLEFETVLPEDRELSITGLSHEGRGLARYNGKAQFVEGALPGEIVQAKPLTVHNSYDELQVISIIQSSPQRRQPFCSHFDECGGCSLQYLSAEAQLVHKQAVLQEQLAHFGKANVNLWLDPITSPDIAYRTKARLGVYFDSMLNRTIIGFRQKNSKSLTPIEHCPVLVPALARLVPQLHALVNSLLQARTVSHIELAAGDDQEAMVIRHLEPLVAQDIETLKRFAETQTVEIFSQLSSHERAVPLNELRAPLAYSVLDEACSVPIQLNFHPQDFTQVNPRVNQSLVTKTLSLLDLRAEDRVLDLFCGLGNFTLPIARHCTKVIGVEGSEDMVRLAKENALQNRIENAEFYVANLHADFRRADWAKTPVDLVLIDPPRAGALVVAQHIHHLKARRIVYISCNPATLARDAGILNTHGYRLEKAGVLDMFPNTSHVESIAVFVRQH